MRLTVRTTSLVCPVTIKIDLADYRTRTACQIAASSPHRTCLHDMIPSTSSKNVVTLTELLGNNVNCSALLSAEKCLRKSAFFILLGKTVGRKSG
jgi:hypothetical protein